MALGALRRTVAACGLVILMACGSSSDPGPTPITSGTLSGLAFTVVSGEVFQDVADGAIRSESGGTIVFDEGPAGLGMTDPTQLQLRTRFALELAGEITAVAYGALPDMRGSGLAVDVRRLGADLTYVFELSGTLFASGTFDPTPGGPDAEHAVVMEFYAESVPGYGTGPDSGITMWDLDDLAPAFGADVLGCNPGPAMQPLALAGDRVAYSLQFASIVSVQVVDQIAGPCE